MSNDVLVTSRPHPFTTELRKSTVVAGTTVLECALAAGLRQGCEVHAQVNGCPIPRDEFETWVLEEDDELLLNVVPAGGGGGGKNILRVVMMIAVVAASVYLGPEIAGAFGFYGTTGTIVGAVITAGVGLVGFLLVNALIPPPAIGNTGMASQSTDVSYTVSGMQNQSNAYGVIPQVLGRVRMYPPYAAEPYTETVGSDQYFRAMFTFGYGPLSITDIRIGDTPIDEFEDVDYEVKEGGTDDGETALYSDDVHQESLSVVIANTAGWIQRRTRTNTDEISVDVTFLQGLVHFDTAGNRGLETVVLELEYKLATDSSWTARPTLTITDKYTSALRVGDRWTVTRGEYDIRIRRTTADTDDTRIFSEATWTALRSITITSPIAAAGMSKIAIRIRATDQLNGVINSLNALVQTKCKDWDSGTSTWIERATSNPASLYRHVLQGAANKGAVADARVDLTTLQSWHEECTAKGREFNAVFDSPGTVFDRLASVAAVGRAAFAMNEGLFSVVRDELQTTPVQHFTPRNSSGFKGNKTFSQLPHALKVQFVNPDANWQQDEVVVFDDGYDATTATRYETLNLFGVTSSDQAWREGRYHLAVARLRPETFSLTVDFENLVCTRGDMVLVTHDVPMIGSGQGRVQSLTSAGGHTTHVTLDSTVDMVAGTDYVLRIRSDAGVISQHPVVTVESTTATLQLVTPADGIAVGDLAAFGILGHESSKMLVKSVEPGEDLAATLVLLDAAPGVHAADTGTIPAYSSNMTLPQRPEADRPVPPQIISIRSDWLATARYSTGVYQPSIKIVIGAPGQQAASRVADHYEVQFKLTSANRGAWQNAATVPATNTEVFVAGVEQGLDYDVRIRAVSVQGRPSDWTYAWGHHVIGKDSEPPVPTSLIFEDGWLLWRYDDPPMDTAGFRVRYFTGTTQRWEDAIPAHVGLVTDEQFNCQKLLGGTTQSFMVRAVNTNGIESPGEAKVVVAADAQVARNVIVDEDHAALGFPGTKVGGSVVTGQLKATAGTTSAFWSSNDSGPLWGLLPTALFWGVGTYLEMTYTARFYPLLGGTDRGAELAVDVDMDGDPAYVEYRAVYGATYWSTEPALPWWNGNSEDLWGAEEREFMPWRGTLTRVTRQPYDIRLTTVAGYTRGVVRALDIIVHATQTEQVVDNMVIPVGGTRVVLDRVFRYIQQVGDIGVQHDGGTGITVKVMDKSISEGPAVQVFDLAGNSVAGTVDLTVKGY